MKLKFRIETELVFKDISKEFKPDHSKIIPGLNADHFDKIVALTVDINSLSSDEREMLFEEGYFTPAYFYYWSKLIYEINKIVLDRNLSAFWVDYRNKKYFDSSIDTCLSFMLDSTLWENNMNSLCFVWGDIDQHDIFKKSLVYDGIIMPCVEGWGIYSLLNNNDYIVVKEHFPHSS